METVKAFVILSGNDYFCNTKNQNVYIMRKRCNPFSARIAILMLLLLSPVLLMAQNGRAQLGAYRPQSGGPLHVGKQIVRQPHAKQTPVLKVKGGPQFWGCVEYSSAWNDIDEYSRPYGIYSFLATSPGQMTKLLETGTSGPNAGGVFIGNTFHFVNYQLMYDVYPVTYLYSYNTDTWEQNNYPQYGSDATIIGTDLAYDATTGNVYGYFYNPTDMSEPTRFGTITYSDYGASVTAIATEDTVFICLAADNSGQLYGLSWGGGLWKIDKTTGTKTLVDYTGVRPSSFRQSATFDPKDNKLYWACFREDYSSGLYEVNTTTGVASLLAEIPDSMEISCLHIPEAEAEDLAPAAVTDLTVAFSGGSLSGTATFTAPTECYDGSELTGQLSYAIVANGDTVATGQTTPGAAVSADVTVTGGQSEFAVVMKNAAGASPFSNKVSLWVGHDVPEAATNVIFTVNGNNATVTWTAPTASLNGGYFDASALTYDVVRYPDEVIVASKTSNTTVSDVLPQKELTAYYYGVTAYNGTMASETAKSNKQTVGDAFNVPYSEDFSTDDAYALYTVVDANGDGTTWNESYHAFAYFYSWTNAADDWLLTPPIKLNAGKEYKLSFNIRNAYSGDTEKYAVAYGEGTEPTAYNTLIDTQELKSSSYATVEQSFTPSKNGDFHFAFHAMSDKYKSGIYITNIKVEATSGDTPTEEKKDIPQAPARVKLTPTDTGITLSWDAPSSVGINGGQVATDQLTYNIYNASGVKVDSALTTCSWSEEMSLDSRTNVVYYYVSAVTEAGESPLASTNYYVTGRPATLPYAESFAGGEAKTLWWTYGKESYNAWGFTVEPSSDHDVGAAYWFGVSDADSASLCTGKITAQGTTRPMLFFDYYAMPGKSMRFDVVADCNQTDAHTLASYDFSTLDGDDEGWHKVALPLDVAKAADHFVLRFEAHADNDKGSLYIDNIVMRDVPAVDLAASMVAPASVTAGDSIQTLVTVTNNGAADVNEAIVDLFANDESVATCIVENIPFNGEKSVSLTFAPQLSAAESVTLKAKVTCDDDADATNDASEALAVNVKRPTLPAVDDLSLSSKDGKATLTWTEPENKKHIVTDDFDSYTPWQADRIGQWTTVDGDTMATNAYTGMWYPHIGEQLSYLVFSNRYAQMDVSQEGAFAAHSGDQCLAAFATLHDYSKDIPTDDWLITPALSGEAQTVSFWVKSLTDYQEDFMVYASTTLGDTATLKQNRIAYEKFGAESTWKKYEYDLPAGTKYLGVRYTSNLSGFLVDDFTYEGEPLTVKGYNVYRDGVFVAFVPTPTYVEAVVDGKDHIYTVSVVYAEGESGLSNTASLSTGISSILQDGEATDAYTVGGVKVGTSLDKQHKGIYIVGGKKVTRK